jgi:hypothetical protein
MPTSYVFGSIRILFVPSPKCPRKLSHTSRDGSRSRRSDVPGRWLQTLQTVRIQSHTIPAWSVAASIQPFHCTCTWTPFGSLAFGTVFILGVTYGSNFLPSAVIVRITVKCCVLHPVVRCADNYTLFPVLLWVSAYRSTKEFDPHSLFVITSSYCFFQSNYKSVKCYNLVITIVGIC